MEHKSFELLNSQTIEELVNVENRFRVRLSIATKYKILGNTHRSKYLKRSLKYKPGESKCERKFRSL